MKKSFYSRLSHVKGEMRAHKVVKSFYILHVLVRPKICTYNSVIAIGCSISFFVRLFGFNLRLIFSFELYRIWTGRTFIPVSFYTEWVLLVVDVSTMTYIVYSLHPRHKYSDDSCLTSNHCKSPHVCIQQQTRVLTVYISSYKSLRF